MEMSELEGIKRKRLRGGHNVKDSDFLLFFFGGGRGGEEDHMVLMGNGGRITCHQQSIKGDYVSIW